MQHNRAVSLIVEPFHCIVYYYFQQRPLYKFLDKVKITVVDNYQGEESNIIVLSLVRNNDENKIGFLASINRVCVALSRAREGELITGQSRNFLSTVL